MRLLPRASLPLLSFVLLCGFQCESQVPIGKTDADVADAGPADAGAICMGDNPAGCTSDAACGAGQRCIPGFRASVCTCDEASATWECTADLGAGFCAPDSCPDPDAEGVQYLGDAPGACPPIGCLGGLIAIPDACGCGCMPDPDATCSTPNPAGCTNDSQCGASEQCITGTRPSACSCDASNDSWDCTADVSAGDCLPDSCPSPDAPGVSYQGTSEAMCALIDIACDTTDVPLPAECGCGCMPEPAPNCGTESCNYATQYCEQTLPGVGGPAIYACKALPDTCDSTPSCSSCFPEDTLGFCMERPEGLRYQIALP